MGEEKNDERRVNAESLPYSLRHNTREEALHDAKAILSLIEDVMSYARSRGDSIPNATLHGIELLTRLARDKADIGTGAYLFPLLGGREDEPLCKRVTAER